MKKTIVFLLLFSFLLLTTPVLAALADVTKIQTFIQSVIQILVALTALVSAGFFVWGGLGEVLTGSQKDWAKAKLIPKLKGLVQRQIDYAEYLKEVRNN